MIYTALILGLLGSFHCIGMCGPIAFLLPLDRKNKTNRIFEIISYHIGRLVTYSIFGLIFGLLGKQFQLFGLQQNLSIFIGLLIIAIILIPSKLLNRYNVLKPIYKEIAKLKNMIGFQLKKKASSTFFILGFFNGLLPCGLVYMAIFGAISTGDLWMGGLYMIYFGLGTIPLMTGAIYMGNFFNQSVKKRFVYLIPIFMFIVGILFIIRGLGLDIPYISPSKTVTVEQIYVKHNCH